MPDFDFHDHFVYRVWPLFICKALTRRLLLLNQFVHQAADNLHAIQVTSVKRKRRALLLDVLRRKLCPFHLICNLTAYRFAVCCLCVACPAEDKAMQAQVHLQQALQRSQASETRLQDQLARHEAATRAMENSAPSQTELRKLQATVECSFRCITLKLIRFT